METLKTENLSEVHKKGLLKLWNKEYPQNLAHHSISSLEKYLASLIDPIHELLIDENGKLEGWFVDFIREDARWFAMIVDSELQGKGYGTILLKNAKAREPILNGWVIDDKNYKKSDNTYYRSPVDFYKKNGFSVDKNVRLELEKFSAVKIVWKE